jgi:hypothetical protein
MSPRLQDKQARCIFPKGKYAFYKNPIKRSVSWRQELVRKPGQTFLAIILNVVKDLKFLKGKILPSAQNDKVCDPRGVTIASHESLLSL